jgi:K+-transporting ATPase c subunit
MRAADGSISAFNALLQIPRVSRARGVSVATIRAIVSDHTTVPRPGDPSSYPRVDIRAVNAALDELDSPRVRRLPCRFAERSFD